MGEPFSGGKCILRTAGIRCEWMGARGACWWEAKDGAVWVIETWRGRAYSYALHVPEAATPSAPVAG